MTQPVSPPTPSTTQSGMVFHAHPHDYRRPCSSDYDNRANCADYADYDDSARLLAQVERALRTRTPLFIRGGNTKAFLGRPINLAQLTQLAQNENPREEIDIIDTRTHRGIVSYDPSELVVTVRAGTPLSELIAALDAAGQMLPCEPPVFDAFDEFAAFAAFDALGHPVAMASAALDTATNAATVTATSAAPGVSAPTPTSASAATSATRRIATSATANVIAGGAINSTANSPANSTINATLNAALNATTGATVGGMVAAGLSGPRRPWAGAVRDYVLGCRIITGHGKHLRFGGQVMKNVAGYDVSRLMAGSFGCLGLLTEVSLKVLPRPRATQSIVLELDAHSAQRTLVAWRRAALPVSGACYVDGRLHVRLEGGTGSVAAALDEIGKMGGVPLDPLFWDALREQRLPFFADPRPLWRLSLPAGAPFALANPLPGDALLDWGGAQRWLKSDASVATIRAIAQAAGGHASCFSWGQVLARHACGRTNERSNDRPDHQASNQPDNQADNRTSNNNNRTGNQTSNRPDNLASDSPFAPLAAPLLRVHQQLKQQLDPQRIFNPGRLYAGL